MAILEDLFAYTLIIVKWDSSKQKKGDSSGLLWTLNVSRK